MKFVVAQIQGCVDRFKGLKVNVDFLLFTLFCNNGSTVHNQTIGWHCIKIKCADGDLTHTKNLGIILPSSSTLCYSTQPKTANTEKLKRSSS